MDRHLKAHLYDISTAIDEIQLFFDHVPRQFEEYGKNLMLRRAIPSFRKIGSSHTLEADFRNHPTRTN